MNWHCPPICARQAAAQLLGPLRPDVCVCAHGVRRTLDDVFPARQEYGRTQEAPQVSTPQESE